jgi:predicted glutamine amidotransferase
MCRFVYYQGQPIALADLVTEPAHSLIHQSFHSHERDEPLNGDGFGVAWYADADPVPALFKSVSPAWSNLNLLEIARVTRSTRVLAHVRAATQGIGVAETNCHPFRMEGLAFMHNGDLGGFDGMRRPLLEGLSDGAFRGIRGSTDSEHLFAVIVDAYRRIAVERERSVRLAEALETAVGRVLGLQRTLGIDDFDYLNCVLTDGFAAVACRFTTDSPESADTLYVLPGERYVCEEGVARMVPCPDGHRSVLVSSEPLTHDEGWMPVRPGELILIDERHEVRRRPLQPRS